MTRILKKDYRMALLLLEGHFTAINALCGIDHFLIRGETCPQGGSGYPGKRIRVANLIGQQNKLFNCYFSINQTEGWYSTDLAHLMRQGICHQKPNPGVLDLVLQQWLHTEYQHSAE